MIFSKIGLQTVLRSTSGLVPSHTHKLSPTHSFKCSAETSKHQSTQFNLNSFLLPSKLMRLLKLLSTVLMLLIYILRVLAGITRSNVSLNHSSCIIRCKCPLCISSQFSIRQLHQQMHTPVLLSTQAERP